MRIGDEVHYLEKSLVSSDNFCRLAKAIGNDILAVFFGTEIEYRSSVEYDGTAAKSMTFHKCNECPWHR